jgi:hypothetical protein
MTLLNKEKEIHYHILQHVYDGYVHIMMTLVYMYAKFGCLMRDVFFYEIPVKNMVSYSAMIACYTKNGGCFRGIGALLGADA